MAKEDPKEEYDEEEKSLENIDNEIIEEEKESSEDKNGEEK